MMFRISTDLKNNQILIKEKPDIVIVHGDTNTSLAGAIATKKISNKFFFFKKNIKLIHIEAGLRSFDKSMSEETNRVLIDHMSDVLFAPTKVDCKNLLKEKCDDNLIFFFRIKKIKIK